MSLLGPPSLAGQQIPRPRLLPWSPPPTAEHADTSQPIITVPVAAQLGVSGVVGGIAGAYLGSLVGGQLSGALIINAGTGWMTGEAVGIPLAVHLANGSRGNLGADIVLSVAVGGAMLVAVNAVHERSLVWLVPISQIASAIWAERVSAAHRVQDRANSGVP